MIYELIGGPLDGLERYIPEEMFMGISEVIFPLEVRGTYPDSPLQALPYFPTARYRLSEPGKLIFWGIKQ